MLDKHGYRLKLSMCNIYRFLRAKMVTRIVSMLRLYEGWNFNSGNYLYTTDTK